MRDKSTYRGARRKVAKLELMLNRFLTWREVWSRAEKGYARKSKKDD